MRGVTLIEVLVVMALLGITAAFGAGALLSTDAESARMHAASVLLNADTRCRLAARNSPNGAMLRVEQGRNGITLLDGADNEIATRQLTDEIAVHLLTAKEREPTDAIRYDSSGRTQSYLILLQDKAYSVAIGVNGETGWSQPVELVR